MDGEHRGKEELQEIAERLAKGKLSECKIYKAEATLFGAIIRNRPDFKYFSGTAQKGGSITYVYLIKGRS